MQAFAYTARDMKGQNVTGLITADSRNDVIALLTDRSLFPMSVEPTKKKSAVTFSFSGRISTELLAATLTQLSDLLSNGVPLLQGLEILIQQSPGERMQTVLSDIRSRVSEGQQLHEAMAAHSDVFNELTLSIIRAGTEGAFLEKSLQQTAGFLERQEELNGKIRGAMAYPAFLSVAGITVTIVLIVFFVPKFADMFSELERNGTLPVATILLLQLSDILGSVYGVLVAIGAAGAVIGIRKWMVTPRGRKIVDGTKTKLPVFGPLFLNGATSRFCRILGTLLRNGVPMLKALEISSDSAGNVVLGMAIRDSAENISSGATLSEPLSACGLIPGNVMAMISIAEEANNLEDVLTRIADSLDKRVSRQLDSMVRLIEPALLMVMGSAVLFVIVALLLPVFEMSSSI
ncbi:MAG: type II secretion system F family protein [Fuerstiella sp.]|nr:type II secretion system F family protein [Fuerstiella sp.]